MMLTYLKSAAFLLILGSAQVASQDENATLAPLLADPEILWESQIIPDDPATPVGVLYQNGVTISKDGSHACVTTESGQVSCFNAYTGDLAWDYMASSDGGVVRSHSKVVFAEDNSYMVYSVVYNENSAEAQTQVIALDLGGNEIWVSDAMDGIALGTPAISSAGDFVYLTHNANFEMVGYFSILSVADMGAVFYTMSNETSPFSPLGIYHTPAEGYYDGTFGTGNTQDMVMWSVKPKPNDTTIGPGAIFGFQFNKDFGGNTTGENTTGVEGYFLLGDQPRDFQSDTAPVLTNEGRSVYMGVTRSGYRAWTGEAGLDRYHFNRNPQGVVGFTRNSEFAGQAIFASPALSSDPSTPAVFGGSASMEFIRLSYDFSTQVVVPTLSNVYSEAAVDPEDRCVYYAESGGIVYSADFETLAPLWSSPLNLGVAIEGDIALHPNGNVLIVADARGLVTGFQVGEIPETPAPSVIPSDAPSMSPTAVDAPTTAESPTVGDSPTAGGEPTEDAPTPAPVDGSEPAPTEDGDATPAPPTSAANQVIRMTSCLVVFATMLFL